MVIKWSETDFSVKKEKGWIRYLLGGSKQCIKDNTIY